MRSGLESQCFITALGLPRTMLSHVFLYSHRMNEQMLEYEQ